MQEVKLRSVLIVDDDRLLIKVLAEGLRQSGISEVTCAYNGQEAVQVYGLRPHQRVLLDMEMPVLDGYTMRHGP
jgi:CheY-like chemotaxis protein